MIWRRSFLGGMIAMTIPGAGGQQPPGQGAPRGQKTPPGVQPGTTGVDFARVVIVFGPSGAVNGVFIYQAGTKPGAGNGPVLSGTLSAKDFYGNAVQSGWVSYSSPGSAAWAQLLQGQLAINVTASQSHPATVSAAGAGGIDLNSGTVTAGDSPAVVQATSAQNPLSSGGQSTIALGAARTQLVNGASALLPLAHLSQFPISGAASLATTIAAVNALYAALVTAQVFAS